MSRKAEKDTKKTFTVIDTGARFIIHWTNGDESDESVFEKTKNGFVSGAAVKYIVNLLNSGFELAR